MPTPTNYEVLLPAATWRDALMPLSVQRDRYVTARLQRDLGRSPTGLLVESPPRLSATRGPDWPPLADWLVLACPGGEPPRTPNDWLARLQPSYSQLLALLLVGYGADQSAWRGWTVERGGVRPLHGFRIIGAPMVQTTLPPDDADARWTRLQGALGSRVFAKVRGAAVAIVGCSRTGSLAASQFAALGVRRLTLIDGDTVEAHNLDNMTLLSEDDLGQPKALAVARRLAAYRSDIAVKAISRPLQRSTLDQALGGADLVVTCVDHDGPRLLVAQWARAHLVPHLDLGTAVTRTATGSRLLAADVRLLLPLQGCQNCVGGVGDPEQAAYDFHAPPGALPRVPPEQWDARGRLGSLLTLNSLAVSHGVQAWLDLLDGSLPGSLWQRLRWVPGHGVECQSAIVGASASCQLCSATAKVF